MRGLGVCVLTGLALGVLAFAAAGCGDEGCVAKTETCDTLDNDCNGIIDDGLQRLCQTDCGTGVEVCEAGQWLGCTARQPAAEECNGRDDDCDGYFDEGASGPQPLERACSSVCGQGTEHCQLGQWEGCTAQQPVDESCNTLDDDCDGQTDEGLDIDGDHDGHYTPESCAAPHDDCLDNDAAVFPGHAEDCNGKDDNCNGQIDEGCSCTVPDTQPCGATQGVCVAGNQACQAGGAWGPCLDGDNLPVTLPNTLAEACDGLDNDCDGQVDEGNPGGGGECGVDTGECQKGTETCVTVGQTASLECRGLYIGEAAETLTGCDGLDNDCDGQVDDGLPGDGYETNEACANPAVLTDLEELEEFAPLLTGATLYPGGDVDWYQGQAVEASHIDPNCVNFPVPDQYFGFQVNFTPPASAVPGYWEQYQLCVVFETCGDPDVYCTDPDTDWQAGAGYYAIAFQLIGTCGLDDSFRYYLQVRSADQASPTSDCHDYQLEALLYYCSTSPCS
ncbi:MAG TPA: putative metal-binding motif-containing protein [Myxococcota bacterium]|nr:putative metal-binding motif-containing protein [Myxococcota bacterium]HRY95060.1 putative metal-binding motif-containing protein [Myxococcota bacterium]HSA20489.1 putative metal-binding motif-containing protein [Myxococcota bacterium]